MEGEFREDYVILLKPMDVIYKISPLQRLGSYCSNFKNSV